MRNVIVSIVIFLSIQGGVLQAQHKYVTFSGVFHYKNTKIPDSILVNCLSDYPGWDAPIETKKIGISTDGKFQFVFPVSKKVAFMRISSSKGGGMETNR